MLHISKRKSFSALQKNMLEYLMVVEVCVNKLQLLSSPEEKD